MATNDTASIIPLHQPKRPMTGAERARLYRERKRLKAGQTAPQNVATNSTPKMSRPIPAKNVPAVTPVTVVAPVTVTPSRRHAASLALTVAAFALAVVGVTMNGWFARSLGSSDVAGWLFLGVGVAADLAALAIPSCAARLWHARRGGAALTGWLIWAITFLFAITAGIGFASVNIADVTMARAARTTPAVTAAQNALDDAKTSRDRECSHGVGKFCREREQTVMDRRQALDAAILGIEQNADPQTEAAIRIVAWVSAGTVRPRSDDFALLRLILLALLPQAGGMLLMVASNR